MEKTTAAVSAQFGDTTYTKVFVGGLAWETQKDAVEKYFEQFGEILEAVVITDKSTGRSKGYGFVTFLEAEAAMKACVQPTPVIDGRRANCNLASLGVQRSKQPSPPNNGGRNGKLVNQAAFSSFATFPSYAIPQGIGVPYTQIYGYSPYSADYTYPTGYYGVYGAGVAARHPLYGTENGVVPSAHYYSHMNISNRAQPAGYYTGHGYGVPYHHLHHLNHYSATANVPVYPTHYGTPMFATLESSSIRHEDKTPSPCTNK